jgi:hypothetical protein
VEVALSGGAEKARWWSMRRAQNRKPATYTCPLCGRYLPALSEHALIAPEGDMSRRRHAHTKCVVEARAAGRLPSEEEWRRSQRGERPTLLDRLLRRGRGAG